MTFIDPHRHERHHNSKLIAEAVIIVMDESNLKRVKGDERGIHYAFQKITINLSTIVHLLVEPITSLAKPKASLEAYISIRQYPLTVTSIKPGISPSLFSFFFSGNICLDPIDFDEALLRVMSEIVLTAAEGEIQLENEVSGE